MKFILYLSGVLFLFTNISYGQSQGLCGTEEVSEWYIEYAKNPEKFKVNVPEEPVYLPLTIHILGTDEGSGYYLIEYLYQALCGLNEDFAATNMQFYVAGDILYHDNTSWYDHEEYEGGYEMMAANNVNGTVNCYFVQNPAGNCGYYAPRRDAVALGKSCMGPSSHTWAHELGHFFSLPHTFSGWEGIDYQPNIATNTYASSNRRGIENVERNTCGSRADGFCDTPPDYLSYRWPCDNQGFSNVTQTDLNGETFQADGTIFMSYSSDNCQSKFTTQQVNAMQSNLYSRRSNLLDGDEFEGEIVDGPTSLYPEDGGTVHFEDASIVWSKVENATHYYVRVSRLPNLGGLNIVDEVTTDTSMILPELSIGKTYYWSVRAFNKFQYCANPSSRVSFKAAALTSTTDASVSEQVLMFPNPISSTQKEILITGLPTDMVIKNVRILSLTGQYIPMATKFKGRSLSLGTTLAPGAYHVILESSESQIVKRLIVTK